MRAGELPPLWAEPSVATGLMGPITASAPPSIPMGRTGAPAEVADAVLFLASAALVLHHRPDAGGGRRLDPRLIGDHR